MKLVLKAMDVEIGDVLIHNGERVTGWFVNGNGKMVLEHGGRYHTYYRSERIVVERLTGDCEADCQETCAYPGLFSECAQGALEAEREA